MSKIALPTTLPPAHTRKRPHATKRMPLMALHGFTLIEMLLVISIIALLIGLLAPTLKHARAVAQATRCAAHLRELGAAWTIYADQYPDAYPYARNIPSPLATAPPNEATIMKVMGNYINAPDVYQCPSDDRNYFADLGTSYEYLPGMLIILQPENAVLLADLAKKQPQLIPILSDAETFHPAAQHPNRRQTVYHDGHVDWLF